jgi:hypothetical protein
VWGAVNALVGYLLLFRVGMFTAHSIRQILIVGVGGFLMAVMLARGFGDVYGGTATPQR